MTSKSSYFSNIITKYTKLNRDQIIKQSILSNLSENAKEIQFELKENGIGWLWFFFFFLYIIPPIDW